MRFLRLLLLPLSALYGIAVFVRNRLFDWGLLRSEQGATPNIVVGNIAAGGTGKTPHTEYLLRLLKDKRELAFLSRGYGRKTKGYIRADHTATAFTIGDEPYQVFTKFPSLPIAVCEDRIAGLKQLKDTSDADLVILDDAFQHRRLSPDLSILLTDYNKPYWSDLLLPAGTLRDSVMEKRRAGIVIVTKCPKEMENKEMKQLEEAISPSATQHVFFTTLQYDLPVQLSGPTMDISTLSAVVGFAGIARPGLFQKHLVSGYPLKKFVSFGDHHIFWQAELRRLWTECDIFDTPEKALITTEKDAVRIRALKGVEDIPIYYVPISVKFLKDEEIFQQMILKRFPPSANSQTH